MGPEPIREVAFRDLAPRTLDWLPFQKALVTFPLSPLLAENTATYEHALGLHIRRSWNALSSRKRRVAERGAQRRKGF